MNGRVVVWAWLATCLVGVAGAGAQSEAPQGEMKIVGTPRGLALAADVRAGALTPERLVPELIRAVHSNQGLRERIGAYVSYLGELRAACLLLNQPVSRQLAERSEDRKRMVRVLDLIGVEMKTRRGAAATFVVAGDRESQAARTLLAKIDIDVADVVRRLNAGEAVSVEPPLFTVPMPMPEAWWRAATKRNVDLLTILTDSRSDLLYYGVSTLDNETRQYFATHPKLASDLFGAHPETFAAFAGHLRIRRGAIDVPGGGDAVPFFEALVGEKVTRPDTFMEVVLSDRGGRLGYLYSVLDTLDAPHLRFVLGDREPARLKSRADDTYGHFQIAADWRPEQAPFTRPAVDPSMLMALVSVDDNGKPTGLASRYLWNAVFASRSLPSHPEDDVKPRPGEVDLPYLLETVMEKAASLEDAEARLMTFAFGQRVFAAAPESAAPDILVTLRGFPRFPMLGLTLERMGIRQPSVFAAATRRAAELGSLSESDVFMSSASQFQGALALVAQAVHVRRIDQAEATRLVQSLVGLPLNDEGRYGNLVGVWLEKELVPVVAASASADGLPSLTLEQRLLAGLAGLTRVVDPTDDSVPGPLVIWEGWQYRVNASVAAYDRMVKIRSVQHVNSVDTVLGILALREALTGRLTLEQVQSITASIADLQKTTAEPKAPSSIEHSEAVDVRETLRDVGATLQKVKNERQLRNAQRTIQALDDVLEALTADLLRSLAYGVAVPDAATTLLAGGDVSHMHDLGASASRASERELVAWALPVRQTGEGSRTRMKGALLAIDVALGDLQLEGVLGMHAPTEVAAWFVAETRSLVRVLPLFDQFGSTSDDMRRIAAAIAAGRQRFTQLVGEPDGLDQLRRLVSLSPARFAAIEWASQQQPDRLQSFLSLAEFIRLSGDTRAIESAEAFGAPAFAIDGCLCLRVSPPVDFLYFSGRNGEAGFLGARTTDIALRVAEVLAPHGLPPAAVADVLPNMLQSILDDSPLTHFEDWLSIVRYVSAMPAAAIEDFVSTITHDHSLIPVAPIIQ